jgi:hypothetical protein
MRRTPVRMNDAKRIIAFDFEQVRNFFKDRGNISVMDFHERNRGTSSSRHTTLRPD